MTAVKMAFGYGFPMSSNAGWFCSLASYSAEATTSHTVAVSPCGRVLGAQRHRRCSREHRRSKCRRCEQKPHWAHSSLRQCCPNLEIIAKRATVLEVEPAELLRLPQTIRPPQRP